MSNWYSNPGDSADDFADSIAGNWREFGSFAWGGKPKHKPEDCALIYLSNRDSDCLDESNHAFILKALELWRGDVDLDGATVESQSHRHWACGHIDGIVIRCFDDDGNVTPAIVKLYEIAKRLDGYPVLDEDDLSEREQDAADQTWRNCYNDRERIAYMRDHASQFELLSFADMLGCARGRYFAGYASELLY